MAPACPVVTLSTPGAGTIEVDWTDEADTVDYTVEVFDNSGGTGSPVAFDVVLQGVETKTFDTSDGLLEGTQYWVRVTPSDGVHPDPTCSLQDITTLETLGTPTSLSLTLISDNMFFDWDDVTDAQFYEWQLNSDPGFGMGTMIQNSSTATSDIFIGPLTPGYPRYFRVRATATGFVNSAWATYTFNPSQLATPSLSFTSVTSSGFDVNWTPDTNSNEMDVDVAIDSGFVTIVSSASGSNSGTFNFSSGSTGVTYYARVRQRNNPGWYPQSNYGTANQTLP